ncbi:glycosyl hydrolases family 6 protein [Elsinoe australis]|uniref:Glucanase n=1 Tax=Elsinoe australis TaxID=40998 RepID=A0A4U7BD02_9PEZI|nr:glycosyl hydrolases family 6 protein [Elsinoe australis]
MKSAIASAALFAAGASAIPVYGQCGGINWSGTGTCDAGTVCSKINDYYSQCIPGTASTTLATTTRVTNPPGGTTTTRTVNPSTTAGSPTTTAPPSSSGNIFLGKQYYANPYYASEVNSLAIPSLPASLIPAASAVAKIGSFVWLDTAAKVPTMDTYLADIQKQRAAGANLIGQFVVYDLPNRDCNALASNGEYLVANGGLQKYLAYVDSIVAIVKKYPTVPIALVIEPDSLANLVTNLGTPKCAEAQQAYITGVEYAVKNLDLPNVAQYIDAGHAGWLGWPANLQGAADIFTKIWSEAGKPKSLRGLATNVANYNAFDIATAPSYTSPNPNYDEKKYINALYPLLKAQGWDARFIVDQGRSGAQPTGQQAWGDWCNAVGTGFGPRPSTNTGDALVDSFVWVKPGGESDGTSDTTATRYDGFCGKPAALKPAPEAGTWFQAYFQQLLQNASPKLA